ncbi:MAG: hypothetical protein CFE43_09130 [Burkholderiales bacterium PBB3]|nr:MAG: hypothetical protein CFE43_09130 [Burkholderiales bacterium PBB3]
MQDAGGSAAVVANHPPFSQFAQTATKQSLAPATFDSIKFGYARGDRWSPQHGTIDFRSRSQTHPADVQLPQETPT